MSFPWANEYKPSHPLMQWMDEKLPLPRLVYNAVGSGYEVPRNLNYMYNFGFLAGLCLMIQIISGVVLLLLWLKFYSNPRESGTVADDELAWIEHDPPEKVEQVKWRRLITLREAWAFVLAKFLTDPVWFLMLFWLPAARSDPDHPLRAWRKVIPLPRKGDTIGRATSGTFSPTLGKAIALARVPAGEVGAVEVDIRGKRLPVRVVKYPFVRDGAAQPGVLA